MAPEDSECSPPGVLRRHTKHLKAVKSIGFPFMTYRLRSLDSMLRREEGRVRTVAVMNEKGGSGKTTTAISLAAVLAERGLSVLVVDLDPQASASLWLGRGREPGLYRAITDRADLRPYVRSTAVQGIDLIAASRELAAVDDLRGRMGIQTALKRALLKLGDNRDLVLIDCPPNLGLLSVNALAAAD